MSVIGSFPEPCLRCGSPGDVHLLAYGVTTPAGLLRLCYAPFCRDCITAYRIEVRRLDRADDPGVVEQFTAGWVKTWRSHRSAIRRIERFGFSEVRAP